MQVDLTKILTIIFLPFALLAFTIYEAFFVSYLWFWYAVPLGLPEITFWHIAGLLLMISFVKRKMKPSANPTGMDFVRWLVAPWIVLLVAYVIRFHIM